MSSDPAYAGLDATDPSLVNVDVDGAGFLYFTDTFTSQIRRSRPDGSQAETLVDLLATFGPGAYSPFGIVADAAGGKIYWVDNGTDAIYRANFDGSAPQRVLSLTAGAAWSLALDVAAGKMYWQDSMNKTIRRANLDGTTAETILTVGGTPYGLALDVTAGKMYWTEIASTVSTVRRANLDGSNAETLWVSDGPSTSSAIALDAAGKMYWLDRTHEFIHRADLDGSNVEVVVDGRALASVTQLRGFTLDAVAGKLYWQDTGTGMIYRSDLDGSAVVRLTATGNSYGLAVVRPASGITVSGRTGLETIEGGAGTSFRIVLNTRPAANVTIPINSSDITEGTVSIASLTFTPANWYLPQTVTVSSVDDSLADGNISYQIVLAQTVSTDLTYSGLNPADVVVLGNDNDYNKFFVVDDASANRTYRYGTSVNGLTNSTLNNSNSAPRGAASTVAGDKVWVIDSNKKVYVYNSSTGALLGSWTANSLDRNAVVEGITVHGNDVWIVDARLDRIYRYANAASRTSGNLSATSSFALDVNNTSPKDLVTDGTHIWVVNDLILDKMFKYTLSGSLVGSWAIDAVNSNPTGITLDPSNPQHLWIVDSGTDRVYQYNDAVSRLGGSQAASRSYALAAGNINPQGIADPPITNLAELAPTSTSAVNGIDSVTSTLITYVLKVLATAPSVHTDRSESSRTLGSSEERIGNVELDMPLLGTRVGNDLSATVEIDSDANSRQFYRGQDNFGRAFGVMEWSAIHDSPGLTPIDLTHRIPATSPDSLQLFGCDLSGTGKFDEASFGIDEEVAPFASQFFVKLRRNEAWPAPWRVKLNYA